MKKILVPTDLSEISENALKLAVELADKSQGEIYLVHFFDHPFGRGFNTMGEAHNKNVDEENFFTIQLIQKSHERIAAMAEQYSHHAREVHYEIFDEDFNGGVEKYIKERAIDLVVMGTTGEETVEELFTGNHTEQVIQKVSCPVISIKENHGWTDLGHIVLGVDLEQKDDPKMNTAIGYINDLATSLDAKIDVVHVADAGDNNHPTYEKQLQDFAERFGLLNYNVTVTENNNKEQGLIAFALAKGAGFLGVLSYAEGGFFRVFSHSTSEQISREAQLPVLTVNLNNI